MGIKTFLKVTLNVKDSIRRTTFGTSATVRSDGRKRYVITMKGWSGELYKYMTPEEADAYVKKNNKSTFLACAEASKKGIFGVREFTKNGYVEMGFRHAMKKTIARSIADVNSDKKE